MRSQYTIKEPERYEVVVLVTTQQLKESTESAETSLKEVSGIHQREKLESVDSA